MHICKKWGLKPTGLGPFCDLSAVLVLLTLILILLIVLLLLTLVLVAVLLFLTVIAHIRFPPCHFRIAP